MRFNKSKTTTNIFFTFGVIILAFMIYKIGVGVIWQNILSTRWWFLAIIALWAFVYLINAVSFRLIIRDGSAESKNVSFAKIYKLIITGYAINSVTPFGLLGGEPYRIIRLKPTLGVEKATSSVLLYMMMHIVSHFVFWIISIPIILLIAPNVSFSMRMILIIASITSLIFLYWSFTIYSNGFVLKALMIFSKIPILGKKIDVYYQKHFEKIQRMDYLIADLYKNRKRDFVKSILLELISRYVQCIEIIILMIVIGSPISFAKSIIIESIQSMIGNLFFFMPMQLAAREGGFLIVFSILSLASAYAIYVSIGRRIRELIWTIIGFSLIKAERKAKHIQLQNIID